MEIYGIPRRGFAHALCIDFLAAKCTVVRLELSICFIEVLFVKQTVFFKAIILLLYLADIKVLKDALAYLGPYPTLMWVRYIDPGCENTIHLPATIQI